VRAVRIRHQDNADVTVAFFQLAEELHARHARHSVVNHDEIEGLGREQAQSFVGLFKTGRIVPGLPQLPAQLFAEFLVVVDDEDFGHVEEPIL
jgi:hypothetical protein